MPLTPDVCRERGIALLVVVSLLTVIGIMGVAFVFSMYLETEATREFISTARARYMAEAGISHAWALLDEDRLSSRQDDPTESWVDDLKGADADIDGDKTLESRWWLVKDGEQQTIGRYAVQVGDEGGKANLNVAQADPSSQALGAINLTELLTQAGLQEARAREVAAKIEQYRYGGPSGKPGEDNIDDDRDGTIDEPDEYQPLAPQGNDRRLENLEELVAIAGLTAEDVKRLSAIATVYSWDANISMTGRARVNVNTATASELLAVLLEAGVKDPWQAAANMADYVDPDLEMSRVTKSSQLLLMPNEGSKGGWEWSQTPEGHYRSAGPGGGALNWSTNVPSGRFRILAHGLTGLKVGDVTVAGQLKPSVNDGESLGVFDVGGALSITVSNHEPAETPCAFRGIELVSEAPGASEGVVVRGIEAVRFNELMINPKTSLLAMKATYDPLQGVSGWSCQPGASSCTASGEGRDRVTWPTTLPAGPYYVRVFGSAGFDEVCVGSACEALPDGGRHSAVLTVVDKKITLTLGRTKADKTYYLERVELSLQPDAEYLELINLSDRAIDASGWRIEGDAVAGHPAALPSGSIIQPHGLLVAAVDADDQAAQAGLRATGISASSAWWEGRVPEGVALVQLEFPGSVMTPDVDWLPASLQAGTSARLILKTPKGTVVDEVEYPLPLPTTTDFQSLEKGDPTVVVDHDLDGLDEGWYPSLALNTPGAMNDNDGLHETQGLETISHDPSKEITIVNRPLGGVGELAGLPSGEAWQPFASADLASIVDRLTVEGYRLEAEGHWVESGGAAWHEKPDGYEYSNSAPSRDPTAADQLGRWEWTGIPDGRYRMSLYGCLGCSGERMQVRWRQADGSLPTEWAQPPATDAQGRSLVGEIAIGLDGTPSGTLTLEAACGSQDGVCHLDRVALDPQLIRIGPVNINTAPLEVLRALPDMTDALASRLIAGRPYGDQENRGRGIGDLLLGDVLGTDEEAKLSTFRSLAHLLTTRSDMFQIVSLGQAFDHDRPSATQRIRTVIQR